MKGPRHSSLGVEDLQSSSLSDHSQSAPAYRDAGFVLTVVVVLTLALFALAFLLRGKWHRPLPGELQESLAPHTKGATGASGTHRRRRRRSRSRNPSRAEVGGLPPRRSAPSPLGPPRP
jgi:hypothetical protein